jgi:acetylornithine deacetylase/succinyl-diaminopimelate desuccinylase-like protein
MGHPNLEEAIQIVDREFDRWMDRLSELISIPSVSGKTGDPEVLNRAADWLSACLKDMDFPLVEVIPTKGNSVVYAEDLSGGTQAMTALIYGHYDVAIVATGDAWESDPFKGVIRGEHMYGRGATDMKGQIIASLATLEAIRGAGPLPVNLKVLIEGEEEYSPRHLKEFLIEYRERLAADFCLNADAGMVAPETPTIVYGLRGNMGLKLRMNGPKAPLHTGLFGGVIHNPIHALSEIIAKMHDEDGSIAIPGFYDKVRDINDEEREILARVPVDDDFYIQRSGAPALWGEKVFNVQERIGARPAINLNKFDTERDQFVIPSEATAYISIRLVPDQTPDDVFELVRDFVETNTPETVTSDLELVTGYGPAITERASVQVHALAEAFKTVWGGGPVFSRDGGGIPAVGWIQDVLGVDSLLTGFASPDDNLHGPNEKVHLPTLKKGIETLVHFFYNLSD